jgi:DNA-directed RNA polymerase specialized sigma24 family protein
MASPSLSKRPTARTGRPRRSYCRSSTASCALAAARLAQEKPGQTLDATALVHEAYLRLVGDQRFDGRGHFFAAPAPDELLALHKALDRLAERHPEKAELVKLRYFAGLSADQAAAALGISPSTGDRHWAYARAWLRRAMSEGPTGT